MIQNTIRSFRYSLMTLGFTVLATFGGSRAHAHALIVQFSDNHSAYHNLATFLRSFAKLKADFEARHPGAPVVVVVNGDFAGLSEWSHIDDGWFGIEALGMIAETSAKVVYVLGNHDGFDLGVFKRGNVLVDQQLRYLRAHNVHILGSNFDFTLKTKELVEPHLDVVSASGRKMRFVGYGLEELAYKSDWDPRAAPRILNKMRNTLDAMRGDFAAASSSDVDDLIVFQHDAYGPLVRRLKELQLDIPKSSKVNIPVAFAGHDHKWHKETVGETVVIDSGSNFDYSVVEMNADGTIFNHRIMNQGVQAFFKNISVKKEDPNLDEFARDMDALIARESRLLDQVLGYTSGYRETKNINKLSRTQLGTQLAEVLVHWGKSRRNLAQLPQYPVVAFYNTSSYRRDEPIPAGQLTIGLFKSFYPLPGEAKLFEATGAEIQSIYRAVRTWREINDGSHSPQISVQLNEKDDKQLFFDGKPLDPSQKFYLALDPWLSRNGNKLPVLERFLQTRDVKATELLLQIFIGHGAKSLGDPEPISPKACRAFGK